MNVALRFAKPHSGLIRCLRLLFAGGLSLILLALTSQAVHAQNQFPQRTDRYINDFAHLLSGTDAAGLQTICSDLNRNKGVELVVVTISSIGDYDTPDRTIESFATHLFNSWGIGDRQRNDGVLLLVAVKDRKVRIEVGSGYGDRYNATMQQVIDQNILPSFRRNEYSQGIAGGARAIVAALASPQPIASGSSPPAPAPPSSRNNQPAPASAPPSSIDDRPVPASAPPAPVSPIVVLGGGAAALGAAVFGILRYASRPPQCPRCQGQMARLDGASVDMYLDDGQKLEVSLGSVDYTAWQCRQCSFHELQAHDRWFSGLHRCPRCGYSTMRVRKHTVVSPTYSSTGLEATDKDCQHCSYHDTDTTTLPMLTHSDSSSSSFSDSSSSSSSSSSDGGGSSSGGGASGSW